MEEENRALGVVMRVDAGQNKESLGLSYKVKERIKKGSRVRNLLKTDTYIHGHNIQLDFYISKF